MVALCFGIGALWVLALMRCLLGILMISVPLLIGGPPLSNNLVCQYLYVKLFDDYTLYMGPYIWARESKIKYIDSLVRKMSFFAQKETFSIKFSKIYEIENKSKVVKAKLSKMAGNRLRT